ncbi:MAG: flagellar hook-associated protein FlgK [Alphaproteobacteria bacterium]
MTITAMDAALTGLRVAQQQISVISNNVANVGTPGYTRKILPQSTLVAGGVAVGVRAELIIRDVDLNLERDLWTQISASSFLDIKETYMGRIQQFHGPPDKELSVAAEIGRLHDTFSSLSDSPEDSFLQLNTVNQAINTANKINDLSRLITTLRNDVQGDMKTTVNRINDLLEQIAKINADIANSLSVNRTAAVMEDKRDEAIKSLAELMDVGFFQRGDGVIVVQTNEGVELASDQAAKLSFRPTPLSATTFYPDSAAGIYVGDPLLDAVAVEITDDAPGGRLGALLDLRDQTFPKQMAQLDELAHKMALRFDQQGLRLFTDESGNIPDDAPPDPTIPTPVSYVGFSLRIEVNQNIIADNSILQSGTYGGAIATGSNEVIRRILEFSFSDVDYKQAIGNIDMRVSANAPPNNTLQNFLGIFSENTVDGTRNLNSFLAPADLISAANGALNPGTDTFRMTFEEPDLGIGPINVDVALGAIPDGPGNLTQDIVSYITGTVVPGLPALDQAALTAMGVTFSVGTNGQIRIESNADITFDGTVVANGMGSGGLSLLGFSETTIEAEDPYFNVQVGNSDPVRVTINPADDEVDLQAKLLAIPGLAMEDLGTSLDGFLRLRPGNDYTNPDFGGDIKIIAGPFTAVGAGANAVFGPGTIADGVNIVSALFGSFSTGPVRDFSPITDVQYGSETDASIVPPIPTVPFRLDFLGPGANISTKVIGAENILDFSQKMVNEHTQETILIQSRKADEETLKEALQRQFLDESGVNVDEELGNLIQIQTAYTAAARVITAVNKLFDDLLDAIR